MDHVAIMNKKWCMLPKILSGEKKIESRWYKNRKAPWDRIIAGEKIYFKNSGEPVSVIAIVDKVLQFSDLNPDRVRQILNKHGGSGGLGLENQEVFRDSCKDKKYCILVFLKGVSEIVPFEINKAGFGLMVAWLNLPDIEKIKR